MEAPQSPIFGKNLLVDDFSAHEAFSYCDTLSDQPRIGKWTINPTHRTDGLEARHSYESLFGRLRQT
jgi:hypothetical protein